MSCNNKECIAYPVCSNNILYGDNECKQVRININSFTTKVWDRFVRYMTPKSKTLKPIKLVNFLGSVSKYKNAYMKAIKHILQ